MSINNESKEQLKILKTHKLLITDNYLYKFSIEYQELIIGFLYSYYKYNLQLKRIIREIKSNHYKSINQNYLNKKINQCQHIIKQNILFVQNYHP